MKKYFAIFFALLCFATRLSAQMIASTVSPITSTTVGRYEKFEAGVRLNIDNFSNPFDPLDIDIYAIFTNTATGASQRVNAFWYQDYEMHEDTPDPTLFPDPNTNRTCYIKDGREVSDPEFLTPVETNLPWRVRFAPDYIGLWSYKIYVKKGAQTTETSTFFLECVASSNKGYLSVGNNKTHFVYKDSDNRKDEISFVPLGVNTMTNLRLSSVFNRAHYRYTKSVMEKLSGAGGNTIRAFMAQDQFGVEWSEDGLGQYWKRQNKAFLLDKTIQEAEHLGMKIQLVLLSNHEFDSTHWPHNPYRELISAPNDSAQVQFFSNSECIRFFKQRLRYIIARWGYSTSILAYELWNETMLLHHAVPTVWQNGNPQIIQDWIQNIVSYGKSLDNKHMYTNSAGGPGRVNIGDASLDFLQDHYYTNDKNFPAQLSIFAQYSTQNYQKPYITGEFGTRDKCFPLQQAFTHDWFKSSYGDGYYAQDNTEFHNSIWSGLFNGSAAPPYYWFDLFDSCEGGQYWHFKPMSLFLGDEQFFAKELAYITNKSTSEIGPKDDAGGTYLDYGNNSIPVWCYYDNSNPIPANPLSPYRPYGIITSNDKLIDVFAAKTKDYSGKIYGWVHNNEHYWYPTKHYTQMNGGTCGDDFQDNEPQLPSNVPTLERQTMTFSNLECDGMYKVDFFSTYAHYDIDGDGNYDDGGIIPAFSTSWLQAYCGTLTVPIPKLAPLPYTPVGPYAPDYAFKISKIQDYWSHSLVIGGINQINRLTNNTSDNSFYSDNNGAIRSVKFDVITNTFQHELISPASPPQSDRSFSSICANEDGSVFYRGPDSRLQCYYKENGVWNHIWMTNWNNSSENIVGNIAIANGNVYYEGTDHRIHRYKYVGLPTWQHSILPNPTNHPSVNMNGGAIAVNEIGTQVYYQGADGRLQCFYLDNGGNWIHVWMTDWNSNAQNVAGDIKRVADGIYYAGTDGLLHRYKYNFATSLWEHQHILRENNQPVSIPSNTDISLVGDAEQIFFRGADGQMNHLYGKVNNTYSHDFVICYNDLTNNYKPNGRVVSQADGSTFYIGLNDNFIHMYAFNAGCDPRESGEKGKPARAEAQLKRVHEYIGTSAAQSLSVVDDSNGSNPGNNGLGKESSVEIFPNPFSSQIKIASPGVSCTVKIYDIYGRTVYQTHTPAYNFTINTESFPAGMYMISVFSDRTVIKTAKLSKK